MQKISFIVLCIFSFTRPIFTLSFCNESSLMGFNLMEVYGIVFSCLFLLMLMLNIKLIPIDTTSILILSYCSYIGVTVLLGAPVREILRTVLPFAIFATVRGGVKDEREIERIVLLLMLGFLIPVAGSSLMIGNELGKGQVVFLTGIERYKGLYANIHAFAHSMFVFLTVLFIVYYFKCEVAKKTWFWMAVICGMALPALFNLYKSYARTAYIGLLLFLLVFLLGKRRFFVIGIGFIFLVAYILYSNFVSRVFFDVIQGIENSHKLENMGSGRIWIWTNIVNHFFNLPLLEQFIGTSFSPETGIYKSLYMGNAHNDYLAHLLSFGYIGLGLYLCMYSFIFFHVVKSRVPINVKIVFLGFLVAVAVMNGLSNSYVSRFELSQYFWFLMGIYYSFEGIHEKTIQKETCTIITYSDPMYTVKTCSR